MNSESALPSNPAIDRQHHSAKRNSDPGSETIRAFADRSDGTVIKITIAFASLGALLEIGASLLPAFMERPVHIPTLWGIWIPMCFLVIPPVHYLCRHVRRLEERIRELEASGRE